MDADKTITNHPSRTRLRAAHLISKLLVHHINFRIGTWLAPRIAGRILPSNYGRIVCPTINGYDVVMEKGTSRYLYLHGWYEIGTLDVIRRVLRPGDVFVDAGASIGVMSLWAAKQVGQTGRVLSFEPLPQRYSCLKESIKLNGFTQMTAFNHGLGNETKETTIYSGGPSPSMIKQDRLPNAQSSRVERLSDVLARESISKVRMIKVDVEGFDLDVLRGCEDLLRADNPPALCVEYGFYDFGSNELVDFLRSLDRYDICRLDKTKDRKGALVAAPENEDLQSGDNYFCIPKGMILRD